jgi:hypothetical protein
MLAFLSATLYAAPSDMPAIAPQAYKYVATAVMLMEINYCAARLQLPIKLPL